MRSSTLLFQSLSRGLAVKRPPPSRPAFDIFQPQIRAGSIRVSSSSCYTSQRVYLHEQRVLQTIPSRPIPSPTFALKLDRQFTTTSGKSREQIAEKAADTSLDQTNDDPQVKPPQSQDKIEEDHDELDHDAEERGFGRSEKAAQATQINLSARLAKDSKDTASDRGLGETWRLVKIARPEVGVLGWAFLFLLVSSSISMIIPFSIGKFLDVATSAQAGSAELYGFQLTTLYAALAGILVVGASANYGRILILRIVGERIVARLRSQLFRRTYVQNAEFFDANRVGDLISRLSSDTVIVGKSITQNLSDGLRSLVSGAAGLTMMAFVSLKLTSILAICFPPVAVGTVIFGRMMRNLSRRIQKNLGTLTKIAEERLGNVRTSQSFAGEILEVSRYNAQVRKIFALGKREAFITATYFGAVSRTPSVS